jgi:hypothetical protein
MLELIHYASLLHEKGSALPDLGTGEVWNQKKAILLGDLLLARSMTLLGQHGDPEVVRRVSHITASLAEGQILELQLREYPPDPSKAWKQLLLRSQQLRLGVFLGQAACLAGWVRGAKNENLVELEEFGSAMGLADRLAKEQENSELSQEQREFIQDQIRNQLELAGRHLDQLQEQRGDLDLEELRGWISRPQEQ